MQDNLLEEMKKDEEMADTVQEEPTEEELAGYEAALSPYVLAAFEEAMDKVEAERNREKSAEELLYKHICAINKRESLVVRNEILMHPPEGVTREEAQYLLDNRGDYEDLGKIEEIKGQKGTYYYNGVMWTTRFATVQALLLDKDILATIATIVRTDCKRYPRPTRVAVFMGAPYFFSEDEILGALARMKFEEGYSDIDTVTTSNGKKSIYSTLHMSERYAKVLAEDLEVGYRENQ